MKVRKAVPGDGPGIANVYIKSWKTTYKGIISDDYLNSMDFDKRAESWERIIESGSSINFIAENGSGEIVGFASGGQEQTDDPKYKGEVYAIYLLESHQRKGLGKRLVKPLIEALINRDFPNLVIWALEENTCRSFYESIGGKIVNKKAILISGSPLVEVAYGWEDIQEALVHL